MWTLLRHCRLCGRGKGDLYSVLIGNGIIQHICKAASRVSVPWRTASIDLEGKSLLPGLVDGHIHLTGGGGFDSPQSRMPEVSFAQLVSAGITTVVGVIGPDCLSKTLPDLLMKARQLDAQGMTAHVLTGGFWYPPKTLTGSVFEDLALMEKVAGVKTTVGEPNMTIDEESYLRLISEVALGSRLAGKAGLIQLHAGRVPKGLSPLIHLLKGNKAEHVRLQITHANWNEALLTQSIEFARAGGYVDVTASLSPLSSETAIKASESIETLLRAGVPIERITLSSDAGGSVLARGRASWAGFDFVGPECLWEEFRELITVRDFPLVDAVRITSTNMSQLCGWEEKAGLEVGKDADLIAVCPDIGLSDVFCRGKHVVENGVLVG